MVFLRLRASSLVRAFVVFALYTYMMVYVREPCATTLTGYCHVLSGYIPGGEAVQTVGNLAAEMRKERAGKDGDELIYVLDREYLLLF